MNKKIITISVLIIAIIVVVVLNYPYKRGSVARNHTVEGYVKQINLANSKILICYDIMNTSNEEYRGDCYIPIEEGTVISDSRTLDSIEQGEHIIATYTGTLAEIYPEEIDGTVLVQFVK